jgi:tetratricopeptide (TPR) repeat protein
MGRNMGYSFIGNRLSYQEYLMAHDFVEDIKSTAKETGQRVTMEISRQTREVIGSDEALSRENIRVIEKQGALLANRLDKGFELISYDVTSGVDQLSENISELNATFHWGFCQILSLMDRMNDLLEELIKIAKTPAQTAAYEQYEIARDAFRQGLYRECIEYLERAISGDHSSTGHKLEWRFYQMMGTVELGFVGSDLELMDLTRAEESFLLAARYAKADYPDHAAKAWLSASWAAYCQGKLKKSLAHTEQAILINPNLAEALFQAAKVRMALDEVEAALQLLSKAIDQDVFYAIKAAGDGDFQRHDDTLRDFLESLHKDKYQKLLVNAQEKLEKTISWREYSGSADAVFSQEKLESFLKYGEKWTLIDFRETLNLIKSLKFVQIQLPDEKIVREEIVKPAGLFRKAVTRRVEETIPGKVFWVKKVDQPIGNDKIPQVGLFYNGTVRRIKESGAIIDIFPGIEGFVHISQLETHRVTKVTDVLKENDKVLVKCMEVSKDGKKIRFSRKEASDLFLYGGRVIQTEE